MFNADDLPKNLDYANAQNKWYAHWEERGYFHAEPDLSKEPFCIVIPPPNVTGALHLGHALNNSLQDIVIRMRRMQGYNALWMPGTDHAGIATQAVVERRLLEEEDKTRHDLGREKLIERIWRWKDEYERRIIGQLKQMGCSCDWERTRFTLDDVCARAVRQTFFDFFQKGLIYRGKRLVNWDTYLQTAVSDDEVENKTVKGHFWHFRYPVIDPQPGEPEFVTIATTRPETMLGDTAVAVHPDPKEALADLEAELIEKHADASAREKPEIQNQIDDIRDRLEQMLPALEKLRDMAHDGRQVMLPLLERPIPLITDEWAKPELGSGCVKITPAHDPNDYDVWQRNAEIGAINILNPDGTLNESAGPYAGQTIEDARKKVVADLDQAGLLEKVEDRDIELPHSDRSKKPIEPYLADQWFVKMDELAQMAMDAVTDGRVQIIPDRYKKSYLDWLGEKRDWPIGRQLWWGHRIPVWEAFTTESAVIEDYKKHKTKLHENQVEAKKELDRSMAEAGVSQDAYVIHFPTEWTIRICPGSDRAHEVLERLEHYYNSFTMKNVSQGETVEGVDTTIFEFGSPPDSRRFFKLRQEDEVLDTWFSSALWPHSTLGWPEKTPELDYWYPTSVLITSRDIITLWVARMVLTGLNNMGDVPFHQVYIHPKILDGDGETMSKSKGNGVDPLDVIQKFGADALRFGLAYLTTEQQDVRMPVQFECPHCQGHIDQTKKNRELPRIECKHCGEEFSTQWAKDEDAGLPRGAVISERFEIARNFCNKLWNASRFALMKLEGYESAPVKESELEIEDRWILSRLSHVTVTVSDCLENYRYAEAARALYAFSWDDFCDYYIEMVKLRLDDEAARPVAQRMLTYVLDNLLRLLHPIVPFITEEIWHLLGKAAPERGLSQPQQCAESIMVADWPAVHTAWRDEAIEQQMSQFQEVLRSVRDIRSKQNIPPRQTLEFSVRCEKELADRLQPLAPYFEKLANAKVSAWGSDVQPPKLAAQVNIGTAEVYVDLEGFIDVEKERARLAKEADKLEKLIAGKEKKLSNEKFVENAPAEVVEKERASQADLKSQLSATRAALHDLEGM